MNVSRIINIICVIVGALVTIYAQAGEKQNIYILLTGIVLLMFGIYRTSRNIPSKIYDEDNETFIQTEDED